jgi:hypothetical protein
MSTEKKLPIILQCNGSNMTSEIWRMVIEIMHGGPEEIFLRNVAGESVLIKKLSEGEEREILIENHMRAMGSR